MDFSGGLGFFLTFSLLDVPYINMGALAVISLLAQDLSDEQKFFLTFWGLDVPYISRELWPRFLSHPRTPLAD